MSADDVYSWANWTLVAALVIGVVATFAIVRSGDVRDRALKSTLATTAEKTASLERDAANARLEQERVQARLAVAQAEAAKSIEKLAEIRQRNLELQGDVEKERIARLKIEVRLAPRRLSESERVNLIAKLKPLAGLSLAIIGAGTEEVREYTKQLESAFASAGLKITDSSGAGSDFRPELLPGLSIAYDQSRAVDAARVEEALISADLVKRPMQRDEFHLYGILVTAPLQGHDNLVIYVGPKP